VGTLSNNNEFRGTVIMNIEVVLAFLLGQGNAWSMFLAIRGRPIAWVIVIAAQTVFAVYVILTGQWMIWAGGQPLCLLMGIYGVWRWRTKGIHYNGRSKDVGNTVPVQMVAERL
jgi:hypothetical protein